MPKKQLISKKIIVKISNEKIREYKEIFDILDKNNIGIISTRDIIKLRRIFYFPISEIVINKIIKDIDIFGDGNFDFKNFVTFMKKQMEYMNENDEQMIFKTIKDEYKNEYIGKKRKREKVNKNKYLKDKKYEYTINLDNDSSVDELIDSSQENIENDLSLSSEYFKMSNKDQLNNTFCSNNYYINKKKKTKNQYNKYNNIQINKNSIFKNVNVDMILEKNEENNNFNNKLFNKYYQINNKNNKNIRINEKNTKKNKKKNTKKRNNPKNDEILLDSVEIKKKSLPIELVNQIEENKNYHLILPNIKYNNYINNSLNISSDIGSKKNNFLDSNLGEEVSFSSDFNLNSGSYNSKIINNSKNNKNYIADIFYKKDNDENKEKMINFPFINNNLNMNCNFPSNENTSQQDIKSDNFMDKSLFFSDNDNLFDLRIFKE